MKVLLTGSEGFVGRAFQRAMDPSWIVTRVDTTLGNDARDVFRHGDTRYDLVIHLAAIVGGRAVIDGDPLAVATNLAIDSDMWRWAVRTRPGRVVYFSSSAAYPVWMQERQHPYVLAESHIDLDDIATPDATYGWGKLSGELLARHAAAAGVSSLVFRPFSGYGTDQGTDYPFGAFMDRVRRHANPFDVWGDGTQVRDWVHIDDVVGAVLACLESDATGTFNIATGIGTSFNDMVAMATRLAGYRPRINRIHDAPQGVHTRVGNPLKLASIYKPRITLEQGMMRALMDG